VAALLGQLAGAQKLTASLFYGRRFLCRDREAGDQFMLCVTPLLLICCNWARIFARFNNSLAIRGENGNIPLGNISPKD
jgi:hypothetical protein